MATTWKLPELGENVEKATVRQILVKVGDMLAKDQPVIEVETDKVTVEVPSTVRGKITQIHVQSGDAIAIGDTVLTLEGGEEIPAPPPTAKVKSEARPAPTAKSAPPSQATERPARQAPPPAASGSGSHRISPLTRRLARDLGLELDDIPGSGPNGEVFLDDVKAYASELIQQARGPQRGALPDFSKWGAVKREPMSQIRAMTTDRMTQAWTTIPHVTHFDEADISALETQRKQWNEKLKKGAAKLTVTAILLDIVARALKQFPQFNASIDAQSKEIIYKTYVNIGIAVDTEQGLLVPVIKNVDGKGLAALTDEVQHLAEKARARKLTLDDVQGGNFTITNLGGIGGTNFTPIINPPEVAILGVSRSKISNGATLLPLGLSYDHRLIDGADAARFTRFVAEALEEFRV